MPVRVATGLERAVFGGLSVRDIDHWLDRHVSSRLGVRVDRVLFRAGRIGAVYGLRLAEGPDVVVKVPRGSPALAPLAAAADCQRHLAACGFPCPTPLDGPAVTDDHVAVIETLLDIGQVGDVRVDVTRRAAAEALAAQVGLVGHFPAAVAALSDPPAWARHREGPWPEPHDGIFDFSKTPAGSEWLDQLAASAAHQAATCDGRTVVGHSDWSVGNLRFEGGAVVAAYDWDSLVADTEPVIAGFAAGSYTAGNVTGPDAPTPTEVAAFLTDYAGSRPAAFIPAGRAAASAAATWVLAYNARCQLSLSADDSAAQGSPLAALTESGPEYLDLRW